MIFGLLFLSLLLFRMDNAICFVLVVVGIRGLYYTCCSSSVHRTTPLGIGSFIGALLMFANLTLVCSVLFGEFEVSAQCCSKKIQY